MKTEDNKYFMMIEPDNPPTQPIEDELTNTAKNILSSAKRGATYRGFHTCTGKDCDKMSDSSDWILPNGMITNSLMVHYMACHRSEIPSSEFEKLKKME